jgi:hypothetical protein
MENVNAAIFNQLKDNLPCQGMGEDVKLARRSRPFLQRQSTSQV